MIPCPDPETRFRPTKEENLLKNKFKLALVLIFMLSALCLFAACAGQTDPDAIAMDEQTAQTETADSETETAAEAAAEEAAADADAASDTEEAVDEESGSSGGLFGGGAASAYTGPRTKVGKMFAGWFASLFEWIYLLTYKIGMPSWILTVFLFTLIVRGAMQPLMGKQMRSSRKMQLLKPEMEEIKKRYASNPQKMNEATQALYKEHDCSPTAGCLPLLIQMPILIWLFGAIRTYNPLNSSYEAIVNSNFSFLWLKDLAEPDPTGWALPLLVAAATFAQTWLTTADRTDRTQRMMMFMMPLMFFFFSRSFPALMCFYWFFYSLLSAAIMWPFMKKWEKEDKARIAEKRRAKEEEAERRRQKKAAAREAYQQKKAAKAKKPVYTVEEGDLEPEAEEPEWDEDEEFSYDPDLELEENFQRYLACSHIKVKEKKMKLHPYSTEAELVKLAYDERGKELDYDALLRSFEKQYGGGTPDPTAAMAASPLGKLFGLDKKMKARQEAAEAAEEAAEEAVEDAADAAEDAADAVADAAEEAADQAAAAVEEAAEAVADAAEDGEQD